MRVHRQEAGVTHVRYLTVRVERAVRQKDEPDFAENHKFRDMFLSEEVQRGISR